MLDRQDKAKHPNLESLNAKLTAPPNNSAVDGSMVAEPQDEKLKCNFGRRNDRHKEGEEGQWRRPSRLRVEGGLCRLRHSHDGVLPIDVAGQRDVP